METRSSPARGSPARRASKRRIPLGLLPYSSSDDEDEEAGSDGAAAAQIGSRIPGASAPSPDADKRRRRDGARTVSVEMPPPASPSRASTRPRSSPKREGYVDPTQPGLSFAQPKGGMSRSKSTEGANGAAERPQPKPAAQATSRPTVSTLSPTSVSSGRKASGPSRHGRRSPLQPGRRSPLQPLDAEEDDTAPLDLEEELLADSDTSSDDSDSEDAMPIRRIE